MTQTAYIALLHNAALLLAVVVVFDLATARVNVGGQRASQLLAGAVLGAVCIGLMSSSFQLETGIVFDTRSVLISISGLFLGWLPTFVAMGIAALFRAWQGGPAALAGVLVIVASGSLGIAWRHRRSGRLHEISPFELFLFGLSATFVMLSLMLVLPWETAKRVLSAVSLPVLLIYPAATMLLGLLLAARLRRENMVSELLASEERHRSLFENSHATMLIIDPANGAVLDANPAACRFYGWSREQLQRMRINDINTLPPEQVSSEMSQARATRKYRFQFRHRLADGSERDVEVFSGPVTARDRELLYSIVFDVTERKRAEQALNKGHQMILKLTSQVPGVVYQYRLYPDHRSAFPFASKGMNEIYEFTPEEVREDASAVFRRLHPDDAERVRQEIQDSARTLQPFHSEFRVVLPRQGLRWRLSDAAPERLEDGSTLWHGIISDITERKIVEEALRQRNEELVRFVYTVSHDLKSPLVTIQTFLGFLEKDLVAADSVRINSDIGHMRNAAGKMLQLLEELLELSRIGRKVNPPEDFLLQEVASEAQELVAGQIAQRGVSVSFTPTPVRLHGDRRRLVEVFQNLIDNAVKFMGDQQSPTIAIGVEIRHKEAVVFVRDNGSGIDPRHQSKLFGLFEKLHPGTPGTGIGLALVKRIIEVHGGTIWAVSDGPGLGSTFYFTLGGLTPESLLITDAEK